MDVLTIRNAILCPGRNRQHKKCPVCGSYMIEKGNKLVCSQETCGYVETENNKKKTEYKNFLKMQIKSKKI